jgi:hypothetical protein
MERPEHNGAPLFETHVSEILTSVAVPRLSIVRSVAGEIFSLFSDHGRNSHEPLASVVEGRPIRRPLHECQFSLV